MSSVGLQFGKRDRRSDPRYPASGDLEYCVLRNGVAIRRGTGRLLNLSRNGILFQSDSRLPGIGEIGIETPWPPHCGEGPRLRLYILARIVRSGATGKVGARIVRYEFVPSGRLLRCCFTDPQQFCDKN
jgi:hypothetical protein